MNLSRRRHQLQLSSVVPTVRLELEVSEDGEVRRADGAHQVDPWELLVVEDLSSDPDVLDELIGELKAVGTGHAPARSCAWDATVLDIGAARSRLRLVSARHPDAGEEVSTRELHDALVMLRAFLAGA